MSKKEIRVTCPCCESEIEVDTLTGKIMKWRRKTELDEMGKPIVRESDWDQATSKVQDRMSTAVDKFDAGLSREQNRVKDLDDLFRKATKKIEDKDEDA